jgi:hypothetical protein
MSFGIDEIGMTRFFIGSTLITKLESARVEKPMLLVMHIGLQISCHVKKDSLQIRN